MFLQITRTLAIFRLALTFLFDYWRIRFIERRLSGERRAAALSRVYARAGARFRRSAFRLQGLIVKVGQFLSARTDVLPLAFTRELSQLQDAVPPSPFSRIRPLLESELGSPVHAIFASFDQTATAAASLGQVHRATLPDGQVVAVKVTRPGIERLAQIDLAALKRIVRVLVRLTRFGKRMNLLAIYNEFAAMVRQELDYRVEAEHLSRFAKHFAADTNIVVPRAIQPFVTHRVLVMQFLEGAKITDVSRYEAWGVAPESIVTTLLNAFLRQILVNGFVHVDPHPGNLMAMPDGRLGIVDFGMMTEIPASDMAALSKLIRAAVARDLDTLVQCIADLGFLQPHADRVFLRKALGYMLDRINGIELRRGQELDDFVTEFQNFLHDEPLIVQAKYMFLGRAVGLLAGLVSSLAPAFSWTSFLRDNALPLVGSIADSGGQAGSAWRRRLREVLSSVVGDATAATVDLALEQVQGTALALIRLPNVIERTAQRVDRGELSVRLELDDVLERLERQERLMTSGFWLMLGAGFAGLSAWLHIRGDHIWTDGSLGVTALCALTALVQRIRRPRRSHARRRSR